MYELSVDSMLCKEWYHFDTCMTVSSKYLGTKLPWYYILLAKYINISVTKIEYNYYLRSFTLSCKNNKTLTPLFL